MTVLVQAVGFGVATLGLPLAADRLGLIDQLSSEGMTIVERCSGPSELRDSRLPFVIQSNSPARDFLTGIYPEGRFGTVLNKPAARLLAASGKERVPLAHVARFLADLGDEVTRWIEEGAGELRYEAEVAAVRCNEDGTFTTIDQHGRDLVDSRAVILATGATEASGPWCGEHDRCISSARVLSGECSAVDAAVASGEPVVVIGGSHSGLMCADLILTRSQHRIRAGQVAVLHRELSLHYDNLAEYQAAPRELRLPPFSSPAVCAETGQINRFSGLRGQARQLCIDSFAERVPEISLIPTRSSESRELIAKAGLVVHACGYRVTAPKVLSQDGNLIPIARCDGRVEIGARGQLHGPGGAIEGMYGLGLGFARSDANGELRAAINVFHGCDSEDIVKSLCHKKRPKHEKETNE